MKKLLVIINPHSGKGKSFKIFNHFKKSLLYDITLFESKYHQHVYDYFDNNYDNNFDNLDKFSLILTVGGDGIFHEVINAIQKKNIDIPIAQLPTGSGNGFFKSISFEKFRDNSMCQAINIINNYNIESMDLMEINKNFYSFLAISWGFISDLDINTEFMRFLGSFRFDLGGIWNIIRKKKYKGTFSYLDSENTRIEISGNFINLWACNMSHASSNAMSSPYSKKDDGLIYITYIMGNVSRFELTEIMLSLSSGKFIEHPKVKYVKTTKFWLKTNSGIIVIDGERTDLDLIEVKNLKNKLKVLA